MKKVLLSLFSFICFSLLFSTQIKADDYNGNLGYTYSSSSTIFWLLNDNDNIDKIYLNVDSLERVEMEEYSPGVYMYAHGGDLKNKEYYYSFCDENNCNDVIDPFSKAINTTATRSVIVPTSNSDLEGWEGVKTLSVSPYNKSIYAIEADKFTQNLILKQSADIAIPNSVFSKISYPSQYNGNDAQKYVGYEYLEQLGIKYLEIGDLYDESNYFSPNQKFSSRENNQSADKELKTAILNFKKIKMNVIARVKFLELSESLKNVLTSYSSEYVDGNKINLNNHIMQQYVKDVFLYWVREYKVDGFYILDAQSYGEQFLNDLKQLLLTENSNLFIYTDNTSSEYHTSNNLQHSLFGSLLDATSRGIAGNEFSSDNFNEFINGLFGGYYNELSKYENAAKVINNIGDFNELDIYSKMALILPQSVSEETIKDKVSLALMSIFSSVGIPRLIAGNEFFTNNIIPTGEVDSVSDDNKVCKGNTKLCYRIGIDKKMDWIYLINNNTETLSFMKYRNQNVGNYPSLYSMANHTSITYDANSLESGMFILTINYSAKNVGDYKKSLIIINFSDTNKQIDVNTNGEGISYSRYIGNIVNIDGKQYIQPLTLIALTERKVNNTPSWLYLLILVVLLIIIFGTRHLCIKLLKVKYNVDYEEYAKQNRLKTKKTKTKKEKEPSIFKQFLSDEPIFKFKKKLTKKKDKTKEKESEQNTGTNDTQ